MKVLQFKKLNFFVPVTLLFFCTFEVPALATVRNVQTTCGATGNGSTDDTAAIKTCISQLASGDTLEFPAGTYKVSSQLTINVSNVTIDGSNNNATILGSASGGEIMVIGNGAFLGSYGTAVGLSSTANELSNSFTTVSSPGVNIGDYVYINQGGEDSSTGSGNTQCDTSGCRGEIVQVQGVSGNTITVTTALHDTYNPTVNAAVAQKVLNPVSGITIQNITFDGSGVENYGLLMLGVANSTVSGVHAKNIIYTALFGSADFNLAWTNITVTAAGNHDGAAMTLWNQGNPSINGASLSNLNGGSGNLTMGLEISGAANGTFSNITVDGAGAGGRPWKTTATRYGTFSSVTVKNGTGEGFNGISLEYYSSHNTYNDCVVTNNGGTGTGNGNAGIASFGNFNQYNAFNNCTVTGNGNVQVYLSNFDALRLGQDSNDTFNGITVGGSGTTGFLIQASNACLNNNVLAAGSGLNTGISVMNTTSQGSGNVLNGFSSNLPSGTCGSGTAAPAPPTGLTAVVQ